MDISFIWIVCIGVGCKKQGDMYVYARCYFPNSSAVCLKMLSASGIMQNKLEDPSTRNNQKEHTFPNPYEQRIDIFYFITTSIRSRFYY